MLQEKVNKLENRVAELERQLDAQKRGLNLLTDNQLKYIKEYYWMDYITSVRNENGTIIITFDDDIERTLYEVKNSIIEYFQEDLHEFIDLPRFRYAETLKRLNDYNEFLTTWDK